MQTRNQGQGQGPDKPLDTPVPDDPLPYPESLAQRPNRTSPNWRVPDSQARPPMVMPHATSAPFVLTPDYRAVLNENFTTSNLDMNRWWTRYIYANGTLDYLNDEWERYRESGNHVMENGKLSLMSLPHNGEFWPSGVIRSKDKFNIGNGDSWFIEGRIKSPPGLGIWPGFWIAGVETVPGLDSSCLWPPEIDIMEIVNNGQDDLLNMLHCSGKVLQWDDMGGPQRYTWTQTCDDFNGEWSYWWSPYDFSQDFHNFSLLYERPNFTIMCDRKIVLAGTYDWVDDTGSVVPGCHVLCNLAIGGSWAGRYGVDDSAFPQSLDVEYIRVWQRVNQSTIGQDLLPR